MNAPMKDFDRMFAELEQKRIPFTVLGEEHSIACEIPALLVRELGASACGITKAGKGSRVILGRTKEDAE